MTPPNVSSKEERVVPKEVTWDTWILNITVGGIRYIRAIYWAVSIAEMTTIITGLALWPNVSEGVLPTIISRGAQEIRLTPLSTVGMLLVVFSTLFRVQCFRTMKESFTFEHSIRKGHKLATTGPYSVVRHPAYSGLLVAYVGMFFWFGSQGSWLRESGVLDTVVGMVFFGSFAAMMVGAYLALMVRMKKEDAALRETFREEWDRWAKRVPYSLIPWVH